VNEETFNLEVRKFLKKFGVTAQREIEKAVRDALDDGRLRGNETLRVSATLDVGGLGADVVVTGDLRLE
jgi:hypothetical protein